MSIKVISWLVLLLLGVFTSCKVYSKISLSTTSNPAAWFSALVSREKENLDHFFEHGIWVFVCKINWELAKLFYCIISVFIKDFFRKEKRLFLETLTHTIPVCIVLWKDFQMCARVFWRKMSLDILEDMAILWSIMDAGLDWCFNRLSSDGWILWYSVSQLKLLKLVFTRK